jgi:hypothetical protein
MGGLLASHNLKQFVRKCFGAKLTNSTLKRVVSTLYYGVMNMAVPTNLHALLNGSSTHYRQSDVTLSSWFANNLIDRVISV